MSSTDKVLGTIGAINTFIENFPMSILDMMHGKVYTSIFEFIIDVLAACGVDVNEIINRLLKEIYGIEEKIEGGMEELYERLNNGSVKIDDQNEFMEGLEMSIKVIFMGLLSSIFTCSAIPVLPNKMFDGPNLEKFKGAKNAYALSDPTTPFERLVIPKSVIDPMGILDISPTSDDGKLFYVLEGKNKYYKRIYGLVTEYVSETLTADSSGEKTIATHTTEPKYDKCVRIYPSFEKGSDDKQTFSEDKITFNITVSKYNKETKEYETVSEGAPDDILISFKYSPYGGKDSQTWNGKIPKGQKYSETNLSLSPANKKGKKTILEWFSINNNKSECAISTTTWAYFDKNLAGDAFSERWNENGVHSLPWGSMNEEVNDIVSNEKINVEKGETYQTTVTKTHYEYMYSELTDEELESEDLKKFVKVNYVPTENITSKSDEYIVCYTGLNPNLLYKTYDMNAFLWYVLHKGMKIPQVEYNHMMWDSRISAAKRGIGRKNAEEWNQWYNSKTGYTEEFKYYGEDLTKESPLYPIMQLESYGSSESAFLILIPAQRYFVPKIRDFNLKNPNYVEETEEGGDNVDGDTEVKSKKRPKHAFNASMYRYNWEYLENIQILRPRLMLIGMLENLLGFSLSTIKSADINFTKKIIEAKLSSAIKSVIESNDMEVEDCYMTFTNDEVNTMLEEMLLSRYTATPYGGETSTVRVHDRDKYLAMINQTNPGATQSGNITALTKLATEVAVNPGAEGSIDYGLSISTDTNILKKLLWALVMPIIMSIFSPQVLLILNMNLTLMGLTKYEDLWGQDFTKIVNILMNKIFGLVKAIILFVKDKIVEILLRFLYEKILPLIMKYELLLLLERMQYWLDLLKAVISCLPIFKFKFNKVLGSIENVDYADIETAKDTPESTSTC